MLGKKVTGKGITIGVLSDSYDEAKHDTGQPADDRRGRGRASRRPPRRGQPATRPRWWCSRTRTTTAPALRRGPRDAADHPPRRTPAKLCFATAWNGEIDFANQIRNLADKKGKCGADVIVDDVAYGDEPMFSHGMVGDAIDDATAKPTTSPPPATTARTWPGIPRSA